MGKGHKDALRALLIIYIVYGAGFEVTREAGGMENV